MCWDVRQACVRVGECFGPVLVSFSFSFSRQQPPTTSEALISDRRPHCSSQACLSPHCPPSPLSQYSLSALSQAPRSEHDTAPPALFLFSKVCCPLDPPRPILNCLGTGCWGFRSGLELPVEGGERESVLALGVGRVEWRWICGG